MRFTTEVSCFVSTHSARGDAAAKPALGPEKGILTVAPVADQIPETPKGAMTARDLAKKKHKRNERFGKELRSKEQGGTRNE